MTSIIITITRDDPRFYPLVGPYLASREVARHVGDSIWDDDGKTWLVATDAGGAVQGFIAVRGGRGTLKVESCYAPEAAVRRELIAAVIAHTAPSNLTTVVQHDWAADYTEAGFAEVKKTTNFTTLARGDAR